MLTPYQPVQPVGGGGPPTKREFVLSEQRTRDAINQALAPLLDGHLLENIGLTGGVDATISHSLGRKLRGWFLVRSTATGTVFDKQDANDAPELTLVLQTATTKTISLWVF